MDVLSSGIYGIAYILNDVRLYFAFDKVGTRIRVGRAEDRNRDSSREEEGKERFEAQRLNFRFFGRKYLSAVLETSRAIMHKLHLGTFKPGGRKETLNPRDSF